MELSQSQKLETKLILTQAMRQSLAVLCMPLPDLWEYLERAAVDNPLLEIGEQDTDNNADFVSLRSGQDNAGSFDEWESSNQDQEIENIGKCTEETFVEMLLEQLLKVKGEQVKLLPLCSYLIYCLDEKGYLRFSLKELAQEQGVELYKMERALELLQGLQPAGVAARNLQECLLLQVKRNNWGEVAEILVTRGLSLLGQRDYKGLEKLLGCNRKKVEYLAQRIRELNPIPSQGYKTENPIQYQVPEAEIIVENGKLIIEMNERFLPKLHVNHVSEKLLRDSSNKEDIVYLKKALEDVRTLQNNLENRKNTVQRLLEVLVEKQVGFFLQNESLSFVTMSQLAEEMRVSISTVSRTVQNKTIIFKGQALQLKDLFSQGILSDNGIVSADQMQQKIKSLVTSENPLHPLSDEIISQKLSEMGLSISRRTVAKYRDILGIANSGRRKSKK